MAPIVVHVLPDDDADRHGLVGRLVAELMAPAPD